MLSRLTKRYRSGSYKRPLSGGIRQRAGLQAGVGAGLGDGLDGGLVFGAADVAREIGRADADDGGLVAQGVSAQAVSSI